jgi:hypothetical protein
MVLCMGIILFALSLLCCGPDILGYISSLTRDNPYIPLPPGGSTPDATERTILLKDLVIKLGDVNPGVK